MSPFQPRLPVSTISVPTNVARPTDRELRLLLECGYLYMYQLRLREAEQIFRAICCLLPGSGIPCVALGDLFLADRDRCQAEFWFQRALELEPGSGYVLSCYGEFLAHCGRLDEAEKMLRRAVAIDPAGADGRLAHSVLAAIQPRHSPDLNSVDTSHSSVSSPLNQ